MRVVATTVVRESIKGRQRTGYIYDVDWEARKVLRRMPIPEPSFPESDDNPRGGVRGGRGVVPTPAGIAIANYDTIYLYDPSWNVVDSFSHPLFVGIHEIEWDGDRLWVTATGIDALLTTTLDGAVETAWDPHGPTDAERFRLTSRPHPIDGTVDYRTREAPLIDQCHINAVTRRGDATIVNCGLVRRPGSRPAQALRRVRSKVSVATRFPAPKHAGTSMVVTLPDGQAPRVLIELQGHDFPTHNGQLLDDNSVVVNDSTENTVRLFSIEGGHGIERASLRVPGTWLRGLEPVGDGRVLIGSAPACLTLADLSSGTIEARLELSADPNEAVHGLAVTT